MALRKRSTINYLSNSELLHEINVSKKSYSSFLDEKYGDYTVIIESTADITPELIEEAKQTKATQLNNQIIRKMIIDGYTKTDIDEYFSKNKILPIHVSKEDLVFRIMTFSHIPEDIQHNKKNLLNRIKFPPFKHYAFIGDELKEVGRSHWVGGLDNGHFSIEHGKVSNPLSHAIIKLVNRIGTKGNFSGYSYLDEMKSQALLQLSTVIIQFDESRGDNPFSWYTQVCNTSFIKVLKAEKKQRNIKDQIMQEEIGLSSHTYQMDNEDW
jgi:hypothetical protein